MKACVTKQENWRAFYQVLSSGQFYQVLKERSLSGVKLDPVSGNFKFSTFFLHPLAFRGMTLISKTEIGLPEFKSSIYNGV